MGVQAETSGPSSRLMGPGRFLFPPAAPSGYSLEPDFASSPEVQGRYCKVEQMGSGIPEGTEGTEGRRASAGGCTRAEAGCTTCRGMCHMVCLGCGA